MACSKATPKAAPGSNPAPTAAPGSNPEDAQDVGRAGPVIDEPQQTETP
jgi:hypothetical protein